MNDVIRDRLAARQAIAEGRIPDRTPKSVWGGPGSGERCSVCQRIVSGNGPAIELEFTGDDQRPVVHHVHVQCFAAWETECHEALQGDAGDGTIYSREHSPEAHRAPS